MIRATLNAADLVAAMKHSVAQRSGVLPILQHALVEADAAGVVRITTTDMETHCTVRVPAEVEEAGAAALDAGKLAAAAVIGDTIRLVEDGSLVRAHGAGRSRVAIPTLPASEFPVADDESWSVVEVPAADLRQALELVLHAAPTDDVRHYLNGVSVRAGFVEANAGVRAARVPVAYDGPALLIPTRRVPTLVRMLASHSVTLRVAQSRDGAARMLEANAVEDDRRSVTLLILLSAETFPPLAEFARRTSDAIDWSFDFARADLARAIHGIRPFTTGKYPSARLVADGDGIRLCTGEDIELYVTREAAPGKLLAGVPIDQFANMLDAGETPRLTIGRSSLGGGAFVASGDDGAVHFIAQVKL